MLLRSSIWVMVSALICVTGCGGSGAATQPAGQEASAQGRSDTSRSGEPAEEYVDSSAYHGQTHWVQTGDTLYSLARQYYGDESQWRKIYSANQKRLPNANQLPVGTKLIIPP